MTFLRKTLHSRMIFWNDHILPSKLNKPYLCYPNIKLYFRNKNIFSIVQKLAILVDAWNHSSRKAEAIGWLGIQSQSGL